MRGSLFELFTSETVTIIEDQVQTTIANFEPRVDNVSVQVDAQYDNNELNVTVFFDIVGLEVPTQSFTFILEPTR